MVFGDGQSNGVIQFYPGPSLVAMATKFGTMRYNLACVRGICETFASIGGLWGWAIKCCQLHFPRPTPVAMAMKFGTKLAIT